MRINRFYDFDLSNWQHVDVSNGEGYLTDYELLKVLEQEAAGVYNYRTDLLYDVFALAEAKPGESYAWIVRKMGTHFYKLFEDDSNERVENVLDTWSNEYKLYIIRRKTVEGGRHWSIVRLVNENEDLHAVEDKDKQANIYAAIYRARCVLVRFGGIGFKPNAKNLDELETLQLAIEKMKAGKKVEVDA